MRNSKGLKMKRRKRKNTWKCRGKHKLSWRSSCKQLRESDSHSISMAMLFYRILLTTIGCTTLCKT